MDSFKSTPLEGLEKCKLEFVAKEYETCESYCSKSIENLIGKSEQVQLLNICTDEARETLSELFNLRGQSRYKQVKFSLANEDFIASIQHNPNNPDAYYNRGIIFYRLGNIEAAIEEFKKAIKLKDHDEFKIALKACYDYLQ